VQELAKFRAGEAVYIEGSDRQVPCGESKDPWGDAVEAPEDCLVIRGGQGVRREERRGGKGVHWEWGLGDGESGGARAMAASGAETETTHDGDQDDGERGGS